MRSRGRGARRSAALCRRTGGSWCRRCLHCLRARRRRRASDASASTRTRPWRCAAVEIVDASEAGEVGAIITRFAGRDAWGVVTLSGVQTRKSLELPAQADILRSYAGDAVTVRGCIATLPLRHSTGTGTHGRIVATHRLAGALAGGTITGKTVTIVADTLRDDADAAAEAIVGSIAFLPVAGACRAEKLTRSIHPAGLRPHTAAPADDGRHN